MIQMVAQIYAYILTIDHIMPSEYTTVIKKTKNKVTKWKTYMIISEWDDHML